MREIPAHDTQTRILALKMVDEHYNLLLEIQLSIIFTVYSNENTLGEVP